MHPAPQVDPRQLRPRRHWYAIAALIAVIGILGGVGAFIFAIAGTTDGAPTATFRSGQTVNVRLSPADKPAIFAEEPTDAQCKVTSETGAKVPLSEITGSKSINDWDMLFVIKAPQPGTYRINCESPDQVRFGVGKDFSVAGLVATIFLTVGLPGVGILTGGIIMIVTMVRRSNHKTRLMRSAFMRGP